MNTINPRSKIARNKPSTIYAITLFACVILGAIGLPLLSDPYPTIASAGRISGASITDSIQEGLSPQAHRFGVISREHWIANAPQNIAYMAGIKRWAEWGGAAGLLLGILACFGLARLGVGESADPIVRGSQIVSERVLRRHTRSLAKKQSRGPWLEIASVPVPANLECRHFALVGTTGSGKTTVLRQALDVIEARGGAALVYDTSGEFIEHYYSPARGDIILSVADSRSAYWSPFDEIGLGNPTDADRLARYLVPQTGDERHDIWLETARILVGNVMRRLMANGRGTLTNLLDVLQNMSQEEIGAFVAGTSSARTFEPSAEKATASVLFMLAKTSDLLKFLQRKPGPNGKFSFREYVAQLDQHQGAKPWIFIPRDESTFTAVASLMAAWLDCAASAAMALPPSRTRRLAFVLDEVAEMPNVPNLVRLLPLGRKFGVAVILTFQSIGQMRKRYTPDGASALLGSCNTKLFLQIGDHETRLWASQTIGQVETEIDSSSLSRGDGKKRVSHNTARHTGPAVLESEFRLPPHQGFLQMPDGLPVARVKLTDTHIVMRGAPKQPAHCPADMSLSLWGATPATPRPIAGYDPASGPV